MQLILGFSQIYEKLHYLKSPSALVLSVAVVFLITTAQKRQRLQAPSNVNGAIKFPWHKPLIILTLILLFPDLRA